ncbi:MAG TPA: efflux RND transporter permease subunit [Balneolaceae bacterium]|nr:efflux RND transporter permease subunit [Balneolaceae bacterium]
MTNSIIRFFLENKLIALLLFLALTGWGLSVAPFDWDIDFLPRNPVPVDAIPDIGDNQQIVFTEWPGRSPQDIEDQITYPLTTQLLGLPGVHTVRSNSMFGFSSINIIFEEDVEFYWSRSRILEKLSSLPGGTLPDGVEPSLGPDATALGQIFWYTLEGYDADGNPTGGWDPQELRSIQDFQVRLALSGVKGVAEVASIGGYVKEYQVDIDPVAMRESGVSVSQIADAVRKSNLDVGARTVEMNSVEYIIRGLGFIKSVEDLEESVVTTVENTPIRIKDVARVSLGPAQRRGALDKAGAEATGGVIVARYGENPLEVINRVKEEIEAISPGLPSKELSDGTLSQVQIVPFYDRSGLIYETLGTLEEALSLQLLITIIVIVIMVMHLRTSLVISALPPVAVLISFIMMKYMGIDANVVALAGIAISIGVVVDMGIILTENMLNHMEEKDRDENLLETIYRATAEVSPAVITALTTTIVSFLPVFMLQAQEGRMFGPLAWTKTFILIASLIIVVTMIPGFAHWLYSQKVNTDRWRLFWNGVLIACGLIVAFTLYGWGGLILITLGINNLAAMYREKYQPWAPRVNNGIVLLGVIWLLAGNWLPLGPQNPISFSLIFIILTIGLVFGFFWMFMRYYEQILEWTLHNKKAFLTLPAIIILLGIMGWRGFDTTFRYVADGFGSLGIEIKNTGLWSSLDDRFPGLGQEFMPTLNEGSFLLMPTAMPHAGIGETLQLTREMDMRISSIPEVETVTGKIGRAESALDPAPVSMFENIITYKSEYKTDDRGRRVRYKFTKGEYVRDTRGDLIPDSRGRYYRQWRDHIQNEDDIWSEIIRAADLPGITSAPKLQPIETRLVMLQTGMRGNMGIRISGPDLESLDQFSTSIEPIIRQVAGVRPASVFADRVVGKPYLEIDIDRQEIARHGLTIQDVQQVISTAIGGQVLGMTVEGRERYPVRVRYAREYRNTPEMMRRILIPSSDGSQIPLGQLADIRFETGPMTIFSENTFLSSYVIFDRLPDEAPIDVINRVGDQLDHHIRTGSLTVPDGVSYTFEGEFRNQQRAAQQLMVVLPITLLIIFLIIYFQFRSVPASMIVFSGIALVWAGGFILLWLYGESWFFNFSVLGVDIREFFQMGTTNLSVAVWVGFLALFGIGVDNGVVMATYLEQLFERKKPESRKEIYATVIEAGKRRVRPCLMTTATTILALLPILTSPGKGSEIMIPMSIPIFGGMFVQILTLLLIPLLYAIWKEGGLNKKRWRLKNAQ